jgi:hypothetical protein
MTAFALDAASGGVGYNRVQVADKLKWIRHFWSRLKSVNHMKVRESGMPDESYWESFFNPT